MYSTLADESSPVTEWATGGCRTWSNLQHGCKSLIAPFADLAEKLSLHVSNIAFDPSCKEENIAFDPSCKQENKAFDPSCKQENRGS